MSPGDSWRTQEERPFSRGLRAGIRTGTGVGGFGAVSLLPQCHCPTNDCRLKTVLYPGPLLNLDCSGRNIVFLLEGAVVYRYFLSDRKTQNSEKNSGRRGERAAQRDLGELRHSG